jgi:type III secretory pathway component EscT
MKSTVFWDVTPCSLIFTNVEGGVSTQLQNVGEHSTQYTQSQPGSLQVFYYYLIIFISGVHNTLITILIY